MQGRIEWAMPDGAWKWEEVWDSYRGFVRGFVARSGWIKDAYTKGVVAKVKMKVHPNDYEVLKSEAVRLWSIRVEDEKNYAPVTLSYLCRKHIATRWAFTDWEMAEDLEDEMWQIRSISALRRYILSKLKVEWVDKRRNYYKDWDYTEEGGKTVELCFYTTKEFAKKLSHICRLLRLPKGVLFSFLAHYRVSIRTVENVMRAAGVKYIPFGSAFLNQSHILAALGYLDDVETGRAAGGIKVEKKMGTPKVAEKGERVAKCDDARKLTEKEMVKMEAQAQIFVVKREGKAAKLLSLEEGRALVEEARAAGKTPLDVHLEVMDVILSNREIFLRPPAEILKTCPYCGGELRRMQIGQLLRDLNAFVCFNCKVLLTTKNKDGSLPAWEKPLDDTLAAWAGMVAEKDEDEEFRKKVEQAGVSVGVERPSQEQINRFLLEMGKHSPQYWKDLVFLHGVWDYNIIHMVVRDILRRVDGEEERRLDFGGEALGDIVKAATYEQELVNNEVAFSYFVSLFLHHVLYVHGDRHTRDLLKSDPHGAPLLFAILRVPFSQQQFYFQTIEDALYMKVSSLQLFRLSDIGNYYIKVKDATLGDGKMAKRYKKFLLVKRNNEEDRIPFALLFSPGVLRIFHYTEYRPDLSLAPQGFWGKMDGRVYIICDSFLRSTILGAVEELGYSDWIQVVTTDEAAQMLVDAANILLDTMSKHKGGVGG